MRLIYSLFVEKPHIAHTSTNWIFIYCFDTFVAEINSVESLTIHYYYSRSFLSTQILTSNLKHMDTFISVRMELCEHTLCIPRDFHHNKAIIIIIVPTNWMKKLKNLVASGAVATATSHWMKRKQSANNKHQCNTN